MSIGRITAWFGGLTTGKKALTIAGFLLLFAALSPLIVPLAGLALLLGLVVTVFRMFRRRPLKRPAIFLLSSIVALVLASGVSDALYGPSVQQASQESMENRQPEQTQTPSEPTTEKTEPEKTEPEPKPKLAPAQNNGTYDAMVTVTRVVDGDTVYISPTVNGNDEVRLIGVDTPETHYPGEPVQPYGPEASEFAISTLEGERVGIEVGEDPTDRYGRLLAYVYLSPDDMFNEDLVRRGYAQSYPYPPNTKYADRFARDQEAARVTGLGIWGLSLSDQCLLTDRGNGIGEGSAGCAPASGSEPSAPAPEPPAPSQAPTPGEAAFRRSRRAIVPVTRPSKATSRASTTFRAAPATR